MRSKPSLTFVKPVGSLNTKAFQKHDYNSTKHTVSAKNYLT